MNRAQVIANKLKQLDIREYRMGFNDGVLNECREALNEFDGSGDVFWNKMLTSNKDFATANYFDNDQDLLDYFTEVDEKSRGPGAFVMPQWGTKGT